MKSNLIKLTRSFSYAWYGIRQCLTTEVNFRIHACFGLLIIILAALFNVSMVEWVITGSCISLVLAMEMMNTAIEKLCDVVKPDRHSEIKKVKDIAAAAVLVSAVFSAIAGICIFVPKIISYFQSL